MKGNIFTNRFLSTRINNENVQKREMILGYFIGPCLAAIASTTLFGSYLMQFYTDVLGIHGGVLTWLPFTANLIGSVVGLIVGGWIDRTHTAQGKAHPWLLLTGFLMTFCGLLLYRVPKEPGHLQSLWIVCSYLLYFGIVSAFYILSHSLLIPLSTRNTERRDRLAMISSAASSMIPGILYAFGMPKLIRTIGIGAEAQGAWRAFMSLIALLFIPATLMEYYFTRERISTPPKSKTEKSELLSCLKTCFSNRNWVLFLLCMVTLSFLNAFSESSSIYYCNWVLGNSVSSGTQIQISVNMAQAPMSFGMVLIWPIARRLGKKKTACFSFIVATLGSIIILLFSAKLSVVIVGTFVRSLGLTALFLKTALQADILDDIEHRSGFRVDGLSVSVMILFQNVASGIGSSMFMWGIRSFGYIAPAHISSIVVQPENMRFFFSTCFAGLPAVGYIICAVVMFALSKYTTSESTATPKP